MHTVLKTKEFKAVLECAHRIATKHITLPILQCVVLEVGQTDVHIRATNLELGIEGRVSAKTDEVGTVAVPASLLLDTISLIPHDTITLTQEGDVLHIETTTTKTDIKTIDAADFPHIPEVAGTTYTINGTLFAHGIKTTAFAASQSSIKPELGSIYIFQKKEQSLTFVATDSFRLIEKTIAQKNLAFEGSLLIPWKNALELARICEENGDTITLHIGENQCAFQTDTLYITSRLVTGTFPDYEQIIPKEYVSEATVLTKDLTEALRRTNVFLNKFMQLTCTLGDKTLTLSSQNNDAGATTESIHATTKGDELRLSFNQRYLSDILPHMTDDSILLKCAGIGRPMVMVNAHESSMRYLVMPMNK